MQSRAGVAPRLRVGGLHVLDVLIDGETVFSRQKMGRMPTADEIMQAIELRSLSRPAPTG